MKNQVINAIQNAKNANELVELIKEAGAFHHVIYGDRRSEAVINEVKAFFSGLSEQPIEDIDDIEQECFSQRHSYYDEEEGGEIFTDVTYSSYALHPGDATDLYLHVVNID